MGGSREAEGLGELEARQTTLEESGKSKLETETEKYDKLTEKIGSGELKEADDLRDKLIVMRDSFKKEYESARMNYENAVDTRELYIGDRFKAEREGTSTASAREGEMRANQIMNANYEKMNSYKTLADDATESVREQASYIRYLEDLEATVYTWPQMPK